MIDYGTTSATLQADGRDIDEDTYTPPMGGLPSTNQYSDERVAQALRESMAQGFTLEQSLQGAQQKYQISPEQLTRAQTLMPGGLPSTQPPATETTTTQPTPPAQTGQAGALGALSSALAEDPNLYESTLQKAAGEYAGYDIPEYQLPDFMWNMNVGQQIGNYVIRPTTVDTGNLDIEGNPIAGKGFTVTESGKKATDGTPLQVEYTYDDAKNLKGYVVDYKSGGDSGVRLYFDANGKIVKESPYDYSEAWKPIMASVLSTVAPALGPYGALANAALQYSMGNKTGALFSAISGGLQGAQQAGMVGGDYGVISSQTAKNISDAATAARVLDAYNRGDVVGAATAATGFSGAQGASKAEIGETGFTYGDLARLGRAVLAVSQGNGIGAVNAMADMANAGTFDVLKNAISDVGAKVFADAMSKGATPQEALAAANFADGSGQGIEDYFNKMSGVFAQMTAPGGEQVAALEPGVPVTPRTVATIPAMQPREGETATEVRDRGDGTFARTISFTNPDGSTGSYDVVYDATTGTITNYTVGGDAESGRVIITGSGARPEIEFPEFVAPGGTKKVSPDILGKVAGATGSEAASAAAAAAGAGLPTGPTGPEGLATGPSTGPSVGPSTGPSATGPAAGAATGPVSTGPADTGPAVSEVIKTLPDVGSVTTTPGEELPPLDKVDLTDIIEDLKSLTLPEVPKATSPGTSGPKIPTITAPQQRPITTAIISGAAGPEIARLAAQYLQAKETPGKYVDPLAEVKRIEQEFEREAMMQNIDPRLMQILMDRMGQEQQQTFDRGFYTYGEEQPIEDIMGGGREYAKGGYVAPLMMNEGGEMPMALMAKKGGLPREDFRDGKHVAGDGDGQSDDIPAWLADGEFVFPADVVSALGNGSTKAGTDKLYEMMHNIRNRARSKGPKDLPPPALKSPLDYLKSKG